MTETAARDGSDDADRGTVDDGTVNDGTVNEEDDPAVEREKGIVGESKSTDRWEFPHSTDELNTDDDRADGVGSAAEKSSANADSKSSSDETGQSSADADSVSSTSDDTTAASEPAASEQTLRASDDGLVTFAIGSRCEMGASDVEAVDESE